MKCKVCGKEENRMYYLKATLSEGRGGHPVFIGRFGPLCHEHYERIELFIKQMK